MLNPDMLLRAASIGYARWRFARGGLEPCARGEDVCATARCGMHHRDAQKRDTDQHNTVATAITVAALRQGARTIDSLAGVHHQRIARPGADRDETGLIVEFAGRAVEAAAGRDRRIPWRLCRHPLAGAADAGAAGRTRVAHQDGPVGAHKRKGEVFQRFGCGIGRPESVAADPDGHHAEKFARPGFHTAREQQRLLAPASIRRSRVDGQVGATRCCAARNSCRKRRGPGRATISTIEHASRVDDRKIRRRRRRATAR